jgi:hypothetical protein
MKKRHARKPKPSPRKKTPVFSTTMFFRKQGKSYLRFSASLLIIAGLIIYLIRGENPSGDWISLGSVVTAVLCGLPALAGIIFGIEYYTRVTLVEIYREGVLIRTKTFFTRGLRTSLTPLGDFEGVVSAPEKNKTVLRYYVFLCHRNSRRSVALEQDIESLELAESRRDQLARTLHVPILETEPNGRIVNRVNPAR